MNEIDNGDGPEQPGTPLAKEKSFPSLAGIWSDLKIDLSEEDMKEARREMWKNFPRDFPGDDV